MTVDRGRSSSPSLLSSTLSIISRPFGCFYGQAMRLRASAYSCGLLRSWDPPVPCVSIGNISWGGTGKTPLASWLTGELVSRGHSPLILTRGYKARPARYPHLVRPSDSPETAGDEPLLLARHHPGAHVVVDPVRSRSGPWAVERFSPDIILLEDGFQHLAVRRDLDVVLLTPTDLAHGWNRVIPGGTWREDARALHRAHALLVNLTGLTGVSEPGSELLRAVRTRLEPTAKPWFPFQVRPVGLRSISSGQPVLLDHEEPYLLVTGIANPERVARSVQSLLGRMAMDHFVYPDHHEYTEADVRAILTACDQLGAYAVTTAKDGVKLERWPDKRFLTVDLALDFPAGDHGRFPEWIFERERLWARGDGR
jgi:tetraacyldisaccharide 4'-kinase